MSNGRRTACLLFALAAGPAGCGDHPGGPSAPSPLPGVPQPGAAGIQLAGTVYDAAWRPLAGAKVEVVEGPQAGLSVTADARGEYRLTGAFDEATRFRASKEGHVAATWPLPAKCAPCNPNWWIFFYLEALAPHPDLTGEYTLAFIADSACADLPDELRTRTYHATVTGRSDPAEPANSRFNVTVRGGKLLDGHNSFTIGVAGDYAAADVGDWGHDGVGLVEEIAPNTYVTLAGGIKTLVTDPSTIASPFYGAVDRCELTAAWGSRYNCSDGASVARFHCLSEHHQVVLTRQ